MEYPPLIRCALPRFPEGNSPQITLRTGHSLRITGGATVPPYRGDVLFNEIGITFPMRDKLVTCTAQKFGAMAFCFSNHIRNALAVGL
jgi:hypothetical protein